MREIKFRAWDGEKIISYEDMLLYDNHSETATSFVMNLRGKPYNYQYMQYTGLKDKNGTEIYEGDIVEAEVITGEIINLPVEYKAPQWQPSMYLSNCKVIGNIYENKELLA